MIVSQNPDWVEIKLSDSLLVLTFSEYKRATFRGKCRKRAQQNKLREDRRAQKAEMAEEFPKFV